MRNKKTKILKRVVKLSYLQNPTWPPHRPHKKNTNYTNLQDAIHNHLWAKTIKTQVMAKILFHMPLRPPGLSWPAVECVGPDLFFRLCPNASLTSFWQGYHGNQRSTREPYPFQSPHSPSPMLLALFFLPSLPPPRTRCGEAPARPHRAPPPPPSSPLTQPVQKLQLIVTITLAVALLLSPPVAHPSSSSPPHVGDGDDVGLRIGVWVWGCWGGIHCRRP